MICKNAETMPVPDNINIYTYIQMYKMTFSED